jgi:hypothetical protein
MRSSDSSSPHNNPKQQHFEFLGGLDKKSYSSKIRHHVHGNRRHSRARLQPIPPNRSRSEAGSIQTDGTLTTLEERSRDKQKIDDRPAERRLIQVQTQKQNDTGLFIASSSIFLGSFPFNLSSREKFLVDQGDLNFAPSLNSLTGMV